MVLIPRYIVPRGSEGSDPIAPIPDGALIHYTMEAFDPDGVTMPDQSGNSRDGLALGSPVFVTGAVHSRAINFPSIGDGISWNAHEPLYPADQPQGTFAAWINTTSDGSFIVRGAHWGQISMYVESGEAVFSIRSGSTDYKILKSSTGVNDGEWHHVAGTYNFNTYSASLYVNGIAESTTGSFWSSTRYTSVDPDYTSQIGHVRNYQGDPQSQFYGSVDDFVAYARALTQTEVQILFGRGA